MWIFLQGISFSRRRKLLWWQAVNTGLNRLFCGKLLFFYAFKLCEAAARTQDLLYVLVKFLCIINKRQRPSSMQPSFPSSPSKEGSTLMPYVHVCGNVLSQWKIWPWSVGETEQCWGIRWPEEAIFIRRRPPIGVWFCKRPSSRSHFPLSSKRRMIQTPAPQAFSPPVVCLFKK